MCPAAVGKGSTECISTPDRRRSGVFHRFQNRSGKEYKYEDLCTLHNCIRIAPAIRAWVWIASSYVGIALISPSPQFARGCGLPALRPHVFSWTFSSRNSRVGVDCQRKTEDYTLADTPAIRAWVWIASGDHVDLTVPKLPAIRAWVWIARGPRSAPRSPAVPAIRAWVWIASQPRERSGV